MLEIHGAILAGYSHVSQPNFVCSQPLETIFRQWFLLLPTLNQLDHHGFQRQLMPEVIGEIENMMKYVSLKILSLQFWDWRTRTPKIKFEQVVCNHSSQPTNLRFGQKHSHLLGKETDVSVILPAFATVSGQPFSTYVCSRSRRVQCASRGPAARLSQKP